MKTFPFRSCRRRLLRTGSSPRRPNRAALAFHREYAFQGTKKRTARDIAAQLDAIGGQINAFTAKECTCFYVKVLDEHLDVGLDVLSDMLMNSKFDPYDIEKEKGVITEEIGMSIDNPEDYVHDLINRTYYEGHRSRTRSWDRAERERDRQGPRSRDYLREHYGPTTP